MILGTHRSFKMNLHGSRNIWEIFQNIQKFFYFTLVPNSDQGFSSCLIIESREVDEESIINEINNLHLFIMLFYPQIRINAVGKCFHRAIPDDVKKPICEIYLDVTDEFLIEGISLVRENAPPMLFDGFSKLVEWLDTKNSKPGSRFCKLRDVMTHPFTDSAYRSLLNDDEFKKFKFAITDNGKYAFVRNDENFLVLTKHVPELIEEVQKTFYKYVVKQRKL